MNIACEITLEDYARIIELAKANGVKPGESMHKEFAQVIKEKGLKPVMTELTKDEYINELLSHGKNPLSIDIDNKGKTTYRIFKEKK